jgi:hypothetical protein
MQHLHERVLERVLCVGWPPTPEDQFGACELLQRFIQLLLQHSRDRADQFIRERAPKRSSDLCHLACWSKAVEAG